MLKLLVSLSLFTYAGPIVGACPDPPATLNFNATTFAGIWYDQAHTTRGTGLELKCDLVRFSSSSANKLEFSSFSYSSATKQIVGVSGEADVPSPALGKLQVNIPSLNLKGEVRVLSTDYTTFAVLWACKNADRALILTRAKNPSLALKNAAIKVLENNKIPKKDLTMSDGFIGQHFCPTYDTSATGLSNSLGLSTSMGSLLSIYNTASNSSAPRRRSYGRSEE